MNNWPRWYYLKVLLILSPLKDRLKQYNQRKGKYKQYKDWLALNQSQLRLSSPAKMKRMYDSYVMRFYEVPICQRLLYITYCDVDVSALVYKPNPLLAMMPKNEDFTGRYMPTPIIYGANNK